MLYFLIGIVILTITIAGSGSFFFFPAKQVTEEGEHKK
jgi:flagellar basal body-associated protein FliL